MKHMELDPQAKQALLERVLGAPEFAAAGRMRNLLQFLGEQTEAPKETVIGVAVFGREPGYDPKVDGVVRSEVRRLRGKLQEYYAGTGAGESMRLEIPKGTYQLSVVQVGEVVEVVAEPRQWRGWWAAVVVVLVVGLGTVAWTWRGGEAPLVVESHLVTDSVGQAMEPNLAVDGKMLVYRYQGKQSGIYLRKMDEELPRQLAGTGGTDSVPVFSWDMRRIAYLREEGPNQYAVMVQPVAGGVAEKWGMLPRKERMAWLPGDRELVVRDVVEGRPATGLVKLDRQGNRKTLTRPGEGYLYDGMPAVSRDGKWLWFARAREAGVEELFVQELNGEYEPVGAPRQVTNESRHIMRFAVLPDGKSVIAALPRGKTIRALWKIEMGEPPRFTRLNGTQLLAGDPTVAAMTGRLVYAVMVDDLNVYRLRVASGEAVAVSPSGTLESSPSLSADGRQLAMRSARSGTSEIWVMGNDGANARKLTNAQGPVTGSPKWNAKTGMLAFDSRMRGNADVYVMGAEGGEPQLVAGSEWNEVVPNWSRDGKSLYFASDRTGKWQLWKKPGDGQAVQVTQAGGFLAEESADGQWLYYSKREPWRGLWRRKVSGGEEELVLDLPESLWGAWALDQRGVYWLQLRGGEKAQIRYREFAGGNERVVHTLERNPVLWEGQMAARLDGSEIYFTQLDRSVSDLFRVELGTGSK